MHIILETPRLLLRQFTEADAALIFQLNSNPEVVKYVHEPTIQDEAHAQKVIKEIILPQYKNRLGRWAVHLKDNNEFIGWCGLKFLAENNEIDLGYRFFQQHWGKGYATEAATHTLKYGLGELGLPVIIARAHLQNIASQNVLQKIGMQFVKDAMENGDPVKVYMTERQL